MRRTACAGELRLDAATTAAAASLLCERRRPHATGGCASSTMAAQPSAAAYQTMEMRMAAAPPSRAPAHEQPQPPKILTGQHRRQNVLSMKMYSGTSGVGAPDKSRVMPSTISVRSRSRGGPWRAHGGRRASVVCRALQWITTPRGPSNRRSPGELGASFGEAWCKLRPSLRQASSLDKLQNAATHLGFSCRNLGSPDPLLRTLTL